VTILRHPIHDLAAEAAQLDAELRSLDPEEVITFLVPFGQAQVARARALDHFAGIVAELRRAGWRLTTSVHRTTRGEVYAIEPQSAPPTRPEEDS
jgi:hypothetical protein